MQRTPADDAESAWIALLCAGVLLTSLAATVCIGVLVLYAARLADLQPVFACFVAGALLVLLAAARLDYLSVIRARASDH
ncbi:MAG: hypothetical protein H0V51_00425 [Chloroflexi bacterium]|nr:hypothetical protein [Chloroflexota bacterium]